MGPHFPDSFPEMAAHSTNDTKCVVYATYMGHRLLRADPKKIRQQVYVGMASLIGLLY